MSSSVHESIHIAAPIERCFALSTRIELVQRTLGMVPMEGGLTQGHIVANSRVVWRGWKFGLPTQHHTLITGYESPHTHFLRLDGHTITKEAFFQDSQERGRFASFQHDHHFREEIASNGTATPVTVLRDDVRFSLPFGALGRLIARLVLEPHVRKLARQRFRMIKELAEGEGWRQFAAEPASNQS